MNAVLEQPVSNLEGVNNLSSPLDVTNRFILEFAAQHGGRILDYGCGAGGTVVNGRAAGLDIYGTDIFYGGSHTRKEAEGTGLFADRIREMTPGRIPFPDGYFDLVTNNQVMEHVEDLGATLREISRVIRPGGTCLSIFPAKNVWREGHIGIPFAHRLPKRSNLRFLYTWGLRALGLGSFKEHAPTPRQWAVEKLDWIDRWTWYRPEADIFATYNQLFANHRREQDYIRYRLLDSPSPLRTRIARSVDWPIISSLEVALFRRLAFLVIVSKKASDPEPSFQ